MGFDDQITGFKVHLCYVTLGKCEPFTHCEMGMTV